MALLTSAPVSTPAAGRPRVELAPQIEISYSLGEEAVELCRQAGQELDPWQQDALHLLLAVRPDGKWACFEYAEWVPRQNGKGAVLEARAMAGLLLFEEKLILWSAHEVKTAMEGFRRVKQLLIGLGEEVSDTLIMVGGIPIKVHNQNGEEGFERLDTLQRIKFVARSKSSGRGFSGDVNIIDEAFAYTPVQQEALMPTMNARPNPQIIYTSTPPLDSTSGEVMFSLRSRAEKGGDDSLGYRDWGAAGDLSDLEQIDLYDRGLWAACNPSWGIRVTPEMILRNRRSMSAAGFAREILGVWPRMSEGGGSIDVAQWARLLDPESKRAGDVSVGVDIAPHRDYSSIDVYGHREDGLGHVKLVSYQQGTDWIVPRMVELRDALGPIAFAMGRGTYASLKADLEKAGFALPSDPNEPERGTLAVAGSVEMAAATGQLIDAVRQETIRHTGQQQLDVAVSGAKVRETGDTIAWSRKESADISPLVAMSLARWGFESRLHLIDQPEIDITNFIF